MIQPFFVLKYSLSTFFNILELTIMILKFELKCIDKFKEFITFERVTIKLNSCNVHFERTKILLSKY